MVVVSSCCEMYGLIPVTSETLYFYYSINFLYLYHLSVNCT